MAADVVQGAVQYLTQDDSVTSLLGSFSDGKPWIFQDNFYAVVKGLSKVGLTVETRGGWQAGLISSTMGVPRLYVAAYSDPSRDSKGQVSKQDARAKAMEVLVAVAKKLHKPDQTAWRTLDDSDYVWCGGLRVLKSIKLTEPDFAPVAEGDGMVMGSLTFALTVG